MFYDPDYFASEREHQLNAYKQFFTNLDFDYLTVKFRAKSVEQLGQTHFQVDSLGSRNDQVEHLSGLATIHELLFAVADQINAVAHLVFTQIQRLVYPALLVQNVSCSEILPQLCVTPVDHLLFAIDVVLLFERLVGYTC